MDRQYVVIWIAAILLGSATARWADGQTEPDRAALTDSDAQADSAASPVREQLAELSQRIDNLIKVSQQQQKIGQYQLVALAAICVLLVVLLAGGLTRRRGI